MGGHTVGAPLEAVAAGKVREAAHRVAAVERPVEVVSLVDWVAAMAEEEGLEGTGVGSVKVVVKVVVKEVEG